MDPIYITDPPTEPAPRYPQRDSHFAHKAVRLLFKSCAAQDIGQNACLLVCHIAHTEDAARYQGPVRFWNGQLMETLGFRSPKQLTDARKRAQDSGWLHYERDGNRSVGRYWVEVPSDVTQYDDSPIEPIDANHSADGMNSGTNTKRKAERERNGSRNENVTESGRPSYPIPDPDPTPDPKEKRESASADAPPDLESEFIALWNKTPGVCRLRKMTDRRKTQLRARLQKPEWLPDLKEALGKFPLKCTQGVEDPWRPDADFILKPDSVTKILEGRYDWTKNGNGRPGHPTEGRTHSATTPISGPDQW